MKGQRYNEKEDEKIIRMRADGRKNYEIASSLEKSLDSVKCRVKQLIEQGLVESRTPSSTRYPEGRKIRKWAEEDVKELIRLRDAGVEYKEIAERLDRSLDAIQQRCIRLMNADQSLISRNTPKDEKTYDLKSELARAGILLWWAEGTKGGKSVQFVNTSADMVAIYMRFLREIGVEMARVKAKIKVMNSSQVGDCQNYWSELTGIPITNFTKPIIRDKEISEAHRGHKGCITLTYASVNLKKQLEKELVSIQNELLER